MREGNSSLPMAEGQKCAQRPFPSSGTQGRLQAEDGVGTLKKPSSNLAPTLIQLLKTKVKEKNLKAVRERRH